MATFAQLIGRAFFKGTINEVIDTLPQGKKGEDPKDFQRTTELIREKVESAGATIGGSPFFLGLISALTAPLLIADYARILNEENLLRPLRSKVRPERLQALETIGAWRRGSIPPDVRNTRLNELGLPQEDQDALIRLSESIPGPQDIIRFAVREVYNPEQRKALDLDAEIDPVLQEARSDINTAGLPEDTFRKFWAAHWSLPSVQQAFEMRHREVINDDGLRSILKALDIAPVWRSRLEAIAFTPFTRVDIRRMHKLGVLSDEDVSKAYQDIGYSKKNAALQLDFVKALNADPTVEDETFSDREAIRARDLTRSDIIGAFKDGLIERSDVQQALTTLGYAPGEINDLIARAEFNTAVSEGKKTIRNLQNGFVKGALTAEFVISFMGRLGLPASFIDGQLEAWKLEVESNVALPTKAEILRWFGKKLIDEDTSRDALKRMSFAAKWIDVMLKEKLPEGEVTE